MKEGDIWQSWSAGLHDFQQQQSFTPELMMMKIDEQPDDDDQNNKIGQSIMMETSEGIDEKISMDER